MIEVPRKSRRRQAKLPDLSEKSLEQALRAIRRHTLATGKLIRIKPTFVYWPILALNAEEAQRLHIDAAKILSAFSASRARGQRRRSKAGRARRTTTT